MQRVCLALVVLAAVCFVSGCGSKTYEERLDKTKSYYKFIERLNQNLGAPYAENGVVLRTPKQFVSVPKPRRSVPAGNDESGEGEEASTDETNGESADAFADSPFGQDPEDVDPRLPDHIDFELPGLLNVWSADLSTFNAGSGAAESAKGYLYLLGNYEYWQTYKTKNQIGDPLKFYEDLRDALSAGLEIPIDPKARGSATDRVNKWYSEIVPTAADSEFATQKEFTAITLVPEQREPSPLNEADADPAPPREYQLYLYANGDMQVALLFDLPRDISAGDQLPDRILLSLLSLDVSSEKPRASRAAPGAKAGEGPGAAPAGGANF